MNNNAELKELNENMIGVCKNLSRISSHAYELRKTMDELSEKIGSHCDFIKNITWGVLGALFFIQVAEWLFK